LKQATWNPYLDRAYFFRTANESLSEREADDVEGRLGPCFSLVEGKCRRPIQNRYFSTYQFGGAASRQRDRTSPPISREPIDCQKFYWRHRRRNQALAALARNLGETNESVAVLTENLAHAEALSRLLRDWVLAKKGAVPEKMPQRMIVTLSAADTWKEFCPATVINAAGGFHSPWLLDWAEQMSQSGSSVRIVDLTDGFDETASRLAARRLEAYREAGWHWRPLENSVVRAVGRSLRSAQIAKE
jgi:DNA polymerase IIIc chi subunit